MHWIAPSEKDAGTDTQEKRLWDAADQYRANASLTSADNSQATLGLIFFRFSYARFSVRSAAEAGQHVL